MRRPFDIVLMIGFAVWLAAYLVGLGPLVGALPAWAQQAGYFFGPVALMVLVARAWNARAGARGPVLKHPGERALLVGFVVWCVAAGFLGTMMLGVIVLMLLGPVALGSLATGVYQARDQTTPLYRQTVALALIILGLCALIWMSWETVGLASKWAVATQPSTGRPPHPDWGRGQAPPPADWMRIAAGWLVPALLFGLGLRFWANWPVARCLAWVAVVLGIPVAALLLYRLVLLTNPPLGA